jgi:hypothetical protein
MAHITCILEDACGRLEAVSATYNKAMGDIEEASRRLLDHMLSCIASGQLDPTPNDLLRPNDLAMRMNGWGNRWCWEFYDWVLPVSLATRIHYACHLDQPTYKFAALYPPDIGRTCSSDRVRLVVQWRRPISDMVLY